MRAAVSWWGEATDEPAREDARPTIGKRTAALLADPIFLWTKAKASYSVVPVKKIKPHFFAGRTG